MKTNPARPSSSNLNLPAEILRPLIILVGALVGLTATLPAQSPTLLSPQANQKIAYSEQDLQSLLEPIALYPDALIALILPASTVPADITLAARFLGSNGREDQIDNQPWDDSVKSLARYPEVIQWMDENLEWTASLGDAFIGQPTDVMNTMQGLREKARLAGNLNDSPQQTIVEEVVEERTYIRIVPTQPNIIYVPSYDPAVVFYQPRPFFAGPVISFGVGFAIGSWLNYDCDWGRRGIYRGSYRSGWNNNWNNNWNNDGRNGGRGGQANFIDNSANVNVVNITSQSAQRWSPSPRSENRTQRRSEVRRTRGGQAVRQPNRMVSRTNGTGVNTRNGRAANRVATTKRNPSVARSPRKPVTGQNGAPGMAAPNSRRTNPTAARNPNLAAQTRTKAPSVAIRPGQTRSKSNRFGAQTSPAQTRPSTRPQNSNLRTTRNQSPLATSQRPTKAPSVKADSRPKAQASRITKNQPTSRPQTQNRAQRPNANPGSSRQRQATAPSQNRKPSSRPQVSSTRKTSTPSNRPQIKNFRNQSQATSQQQKNPSNRKSSGGSRLKAPQKSQSVPNRSQARSSKSSSAKQRPAATRTQNNSLRQQAASAGEGSGKDRQKKRNR